MPCNRGGANWKMILWLSITVQDLSTDMMFLFQVVVSLVLAAALGAVFYWCMGVRRTKTKPNHQERLPNSVSRLLTHVDEKVEDLSLPKLTSKHNIFLSHSGAQKPFVEQLCKDLEATCHYPFFDQRDDSLPKGKMFAKLILEAARKCRVAVIVLSKEFLSSKWPMLELAEFVNAIESDNKNLILLPLFFKLSISDLSDESISNTWMLEWTKLAKKGSRVDVKKWKKAVQVLRAINGLNFAKFGNSEVNYREAVVKAIFKVVPPALLHQTSGVQGCDRICKILLEMFVEHTPSSDRSLPQPQKLGLYGMGGLGKTTMCKALCNHFQEEFCGRVCHVELGSEIPLILQKRVLKNMLRVNDELLERVSNTSEGLQILKEKMGCHPVFLAIDNVGDAEESRTEACAFLRCNFHPGSKIMVVSRSKQVVEALLEDPEYCKPLPDLMIEEAAAIFLSKATVSQKEYSSLVSSEERNIVDVCLKECLFSPGGDTNADLKKHGQYHPLALAALGVYFHDISSTNLLLWKTRLNEFDKLKRSRDCPHIFLILGLQFSTFDETKKLMFLDVALYARGWLGSFELKSFEHWVKWLAALHGNIKAVKDKLGDLQRNAMINLGESAVTTHDLYKEYAEWYVAKNGDAKAPWCVYQEHAEEYLPHELERSAPGGWWPDLMRISMEGNLKYARFSSKKVQEWRNIVVLQLHFCVSVTKLDLHGFSCLCHLELVGLTKLETLIFSADGDEDDYPFKLQFVFLRKLPALKHLPSFSQCTALRMFIMRDCSNLTEPLASLELCSHVETFEMDWCPGRLCAPNLSDMTLLENLSIVNTHGETNVHPIDELKGLGNLTNLRLLNLSCLLIKRLPGLERLANLRQISLEHCWLLTELPDLSGLTQVELLNISWTKVQEIHGVDQMSQLRILDCTWCEELERLPDLDHLGHLRYVITRGCCRLTKHPRVPKHPCFHDRDKLVSKKILPSSESEDDYDPLDDLGSDFS